MSSAQGQPGLTVPVHQVMTSLRVLPAGRVDDDRSEKMCRDLSGARMLVVLIVVTGLSEVAHAGDPFAELSLIRPRKPTAAPRFTAPRVNSQPLRLSDLKGRVVSSTSGRRSVAHAGRGWRRWSGCTSTPRPGADDRRNLC